MIAFLLTFADDLLDTASYIMVSLRAATSKSGTMVAIKDRANDCAA